VTISVKMDLIEIMGQSVVDKDMFCVHWIMKGLRGRENTGETENVRASMSSDNYAIATFRDVFSGEVQVKPRKDGSGYEPMDFDMRVTQPALHRKDEKAVGKAIINIFEKIAVLTPGQPAVSDQTVPLVKDGSAVVHVKATVQIKGDATDEQPEIVDADQATPAGDSESSHLVVKNPPASPQKESGSESGSTAPSEGKEETTSKRTHKKRRSSNTSAMAAIALKKKEEELQQKEAEHEEEKKKLNEQIAAKDTEIDSLKKANQHLESRVKELEQAKEQTDVVPIDPQEEKMQNDLRRLQAQTEVLQDQKTALVEEKDQALRQIAELTEALEEEKKKNEELRSSAGSVDSKDKELALLKDQLAELKAELGKKGGAPSAAAAAPAPNNMMMQGIIAAVGAVLGIIIGHFIF